MIEGQSHPTLRVGAGRVFTSNTSSPIDWNQNNAADPPYSADINFDGTVGVLTGFQDWSAIQFAPIGPGAARAAHSVRAPASQELTKAQDDQIPTDFEVSVDIEDEIESAAPGDFVDYQVSITNEGLEADTYTLTATSSLGWADFADLPNELTLSPGEAQTFVFTVEVPDNTPPGQTDESTILVTSSNSPRLRDETEALTEVAGVSACAGDCNTDQAVTIEELITLVNISLDLEDTGACATAPAAPAAARAAPAATVAAPLATPPAALVATLAAASAAPCTAWSIFSPACSAEPSSPRLHPPRLMAAASATAAVNAPIFDVSIRPRFGFRDL